MGIEFTAVCWRDMIKFFRLKEVLFASLIQPIFWLVIFGQGMSGYVENNMPSVPTLPGVISIDYLTFLSAGIISMTILFTCLYSGVFLQLDKQTGLLKQMLASPLKRSHILAGLSLSGATKSLIQVIVIVIFGIILGVRFFAGFALSTAVISMLGIVLFVILFALGLMFLSLAISIKIKSHEGVQAVIALLTLPIFFASNALYPIESMALPMKFVSCLNPLTYFINGVRYFSIGSDFYAFGARYSITANDMLVSLAFLAAFCVAMYLISVRTFKKANVV